MLNTAFEAFSDNSGGSDGIPAGMMMRRGKVAPVQTAHAAKNKTARRCR
jgi:hypothetical protein